MIIKYTLSRIFSGTRIRTPNVILHEKLSGEVNETLKGVLTQTL